MTDEEKKQYRETLIERCKQYSHIDYDDDMDIVELMIDSVLEDMEELIRGFDRYEMTGRQYILVLSSFKELYDNREKYEDAKGLSSAVSSMLLKEMCKGGSV